MNPPDAYGQVLDYIWDGRTGDIDNNDFVFPNQDYAFKDSNQAGTYPSGETESINQNDFQFDDDTFASADGLVSCLCSAGGASQQRGAASGIRAGDSHL